MYNFLVSYRFLDCISADRVPVKDGHAGLRMMRLLEAAEKSLKNRGKLDRNR
jgi:hypothetical protein